MEITRSSYYTVKVHNVPESEVHTEVVDNEGNIVQTTHHVDLRRVTQESWPNGDVTESDRLIRSVYCTSMLQAYTVAKAMCEEYDA